MTSPADFYAKAVSAGPAASTEGGESGFFSVPRPELDPSLFEGHTLRSEVSIWVRARLYEALTKLGLKQPIKWTYIWLAGSGAGYQWEANRGNGDLDVLFGVDFPEFVRRNPDWGGMSEEQFASWVNTQLRTDLWPRTKAAHFGSRIYEVTFYLNPGVGRDISQINPYAAWDLRRNEWAVVPDVTMAEHSYPGAWASAVDHDTASVQHMVEQHNALRSQLASVPEGSAQWHNLGDSLRRNSEAAKALFDEIHEGRHAAFGPGGRGYEDYANFRWQVAKQQGTINGLHGILNARQNAEHQLSDELYGGPIASADEALTHAAMVHQHRPGLR